VTHAGLTQRLTAILAADVAGYARLMAADAGATVAALDGARAVFRRQIEAHRGRVVDMVGDSVLALFDTAAGAVNAGLAVQKALETTSASIPEDRRMRVRIGLHLGDVIEKTDGTVYGTGVNVAARLQAKARPGGLCLSQTLYEAAKDALPEGARFGGRQRLKHIEEPIAIWHIVPEGAAPEHYGPEALDAAPNNLPLQLTSFIGREGELAEVGRLLAQSRLLTLLGAGGIGKSRLSLEVAAEVIEDFDDGVWFVELATLRDARLVPQAVASVMGVKEAAGRPVTEALVRHFKDRRTLLILDNCEHLLQGCAELARTLLQAGPHAKVLASSREPLRVAGETTYPVPALPESEAVRLFVDRAAKARPDFRVNGEATAVASVCRRLDGLPLAIELAAARVRALSVKAIDARLDDRFRLLSHGDQSALPRQQTLRALIDWSYDLLTEDERRVFQRLAVFAGGFTADAAEAVAGDALEHLTQLVEKSLVVMDARGERYRLLDTVRQYAHERLDESRDADEARERHLQFYLGLAEKAWPELTGPKQGEWLARLDLERENLLAAHAWCDRAPRGAEHGLRLAYLLRAYWLNRGLLGPGYRFTEEALNRSGAGARDLARSRALFVAGQLSVTMGRYGEAPRYLEESLHIAREIGDRRRVAAALQPLGTAHVGLGDLPTARRYLQEALALAEQHGAQREIAAAGNALAQLCRVEGNLERAEALYAQVLAFMRKLEDRESIAIVLLNQAMVAIARGDDERARSMLLEVLAIADEIGSKPVGQSVFEVSAGLAALRQDWPRVARFYGAAEAQAAQTGLHRDPGDEAFLAPLLARARAALGAQGFPAAESAGRELPFEQAMAEARAWLFGARPTIR
jgi:predicted ATPase/class 3 adenylate cyclase